MNRLQFEASPYLKQHEHNPVDWYPWGEEALKKAKTENKPILLSVGYSACHWCHVMAHESFENPEIAKIMNERYVNIKVDREERPDLDQIYQPVAQMITKGGGWPLTVFLTPDLKPFYGGTYFPPSDRYGRPGFPRLLLALSEGFKKDRAGMEDRAEKITEIIQDSDEFSGNENFNLPETFSQNIFSSEQARETLKQALDKLLTYVDWENGGFGGAPKFPNPMVITFLWRMSQMEWAPHSHRESAREATHLALNKMAKGGIFDQLGGGFHRYTVDAEWLVPHFEKMLYDNGLLLKLYAEVLISDPALATENRNLYLETLQKTILYIEREMTSKEGLFYAAQDADSEGEEGKFFVWDRNELREILSPQETEEFCNSFGVSEQGNFEHGKSVLTRATEKLNLGLTQKVFDARKKRIAPGLDSKTLVSWNGLMISGLVHASIALEKFQDPETASIARKLAEKAFLEIRERASQTGAGLYSTIQEGTPRFDGYLDDYAFLATAALDLARIFPEQRELLNQAAKEWTEKLNQDFKDRESLGYFFTSGHHADLIHRPKSYFDQAIPSGNAVTYGLVRVLTEMSYIEHDPRAETEVSILMRSALQNPYGLGEFLNSLLLYAVSPVLIKGRTKLSAEITGNPFCFFEAGEVSPGKTQYCHRQTCHLDGFEVRSLFFV